jgi:hypothetical protein
MYTDIIEVYNDQQATFIEDEEIITCGDCK